MLKEVTQRVDDVVDQIASGDHAGAAEQFVETVALGPGTWALLPQEIQQTLIENAVTFLDESHDLEQLRFDLEWIREFLSQPCSRLVVQVHQPSRQLLLNSQRLFRVWRSLNFWMLDTFLMLPIRTPMLMRLSLS